MRAFKVQAPSAIRGSPVARPVTPPRIQLFLRRDEAAHRIDPFAAGLGTIQLLDLDGRYRELYDRQYRIERNRFINPGEDFTPEPAASPTTDRR